MLLEAGRHLEDPSLWDLLEIFGHYYFVEYSINRRLVANLRIYFSSESSGRWHTTNPQENIFDAQGNEKIFIASQSKSI